MSDDLKLFEGVPAPAGVPTAGPRPQPDLEPVLTVTVYGIPGPQGSKRHVGGGRMIESSAKVGPWRDAVAWRAIEARGKVRRWRALTGPVALSMTFTFARAKDHFGTGRNAGALLPSAPPRPTGYPDLSKIVRSTEDALTTAGVYRDDALVVEYRRLGKWFATDHGAVPDVLDAPGCVIRVWPAWTGADA